MSGARSDDAVGLVFTALADGTRRSLLASLAAHGGATATELAAASPITRQAVAKHLAVLSAAGLVAPERVGRETRYRVVPGSLRSVGSWISDTDAAWSHRLARLQHHLAGRVAASEPDAVLPDVIQRYQSAHDAGDTDAALSAFATDAEVADDGGVYRGAGEIRGWLSTSASAFTYTRSPIAAEQVGPTRWLVQNHVEGDFPGGMVDLRYEFVVIDDLITALTIAP